MNTKFKEEKKYKLIRGGNWAVFRLNGYGIE